MYLILTTTTEVCTILVPIFIDGEKLVQGHVKQYPPNPDGGRM